MPLADEIKLNRRPDYDRVLEWVARVLKNSAIIEPPVNPREISESYGISVDYVVFNQEHSDVAGFFDFGENKIYVNAEDAYNRKTFTVAHELGHYFLHREIFKEDPNEYRVLLRRPMASADNPLEKEANAFGANLLVPRKFLDRFRGNATEDELAQIFVVSKDVIRNRLRFEFGDQA